MKKRYSVLLGMLLLTALLSGCGKKEGTPQEENPQQEAVSGETENIAEDEGPQIENWGTSPEYTSTLITSTPIRFLSVTVGVTEEEVNLTWFSPSENAGCVYWTSADDADFQNASVFDATSSPSETIEGYYINRATVTGLASGTDYIYQVGEGENMSPAYAYTVPVFSDSFRFTAVGDAQLGKPVEELDRQKGTWHKVLNKIKYHFPDSAFLVSLGDQVNDFDDMEQYGAFLNQGALYSMPLVPIKGNHDVGGPQYSEHFTLPNLSSLGTCDDEGDGDYWFVRGNALFMVLDVMDTAKWGEHKDFIASAVEANPDARWRIVFSHYSPYNGYEDYMEKAQELRPYFLEFADAYDIDLVMSGHDHSYTRTYFIQADGSFTEYESPAENPEGTMYMILSSSSGSLYRRPSPQNETAISKKRSSPEVTDVLVSADSLKICTYDAETWELTDEFEIQKQ